MDIIKISIKRPVFISSIVLLTLIIGFTSFRKLGVDLFPDVTFPIISVQTIYPGASPNDIEEQISKPIEEGIASLSGLKRLYSTNLESVSIITAEFQFGTDVRNAEQEIRQRLNTIKSKLPNEVDDPLVRRLDPADQPIVRLSVTSKLPKTELFDLIEAKVKNRLERIQGVGLVEIIGGQRKEIEVAVDKDKLQRFELSMLQVAQRIGGTSKNIPIGSVNAGKSEKTLRSVGDFRTLKDLSTVNVNFIGSDKAILLKDIATLREGASEEFTRAFYNSTPSLILDVYRQSGSNTVEVATQVLAVLDEINKNFEAQKIDAKTSLVRDGARPIRANVQDVEESILFGIFLCVVVVFFFLGSFKSTVITGMALPNSLLGAFVIMYILGFTINIMTLLALSLAVGLLVDDAIVVRENIFRHLEMGKDPETAAEEGTKEVTMAVIATTLVVLAIFGPIAFLQGIVGQFFKQFGLTICFAMIISTFDALMVAPMMSAAWANRVHKRGNGILDRILNAFDAVQTKLEDIYESILKLTLRNPKTVITLSLLSFVGSLFLTQFIQKTFIPAADNGEFEISMELEPGASLERTSDLALRIEKIVRDNPAILHTSVLIGNRNKESNVASIYARLVESKLRTQNTFAVKAQMRERMKAFQTEGTINVQDFDFVGGGQRPFVLVLSGDNLDKLTEYSGNLLEKMKKIPGLVDLTSSAQKGKPEFQIRFDREKAESLGVPTSQAGAELRARVEGIVPAVFRQGGEEYDIRLRLDEKFRDLAAEFQTTMIPNVNFNMIPLSKVAVGEEVQGFSNINRLNKSRMILFEGDIGAGGGLGDIVDNTNILLQKDFAPPEGITYQFIGQAQDFQDLLDSMTLAIGLGVIFIYLVLSSLYESFLTPFTILLAMPMAISGALIALLIANESINLFSLIGLVMLLGVVTKNSILLVDYTLQLQARGMERAQALILAGKTRLRPILMTSFALVAGTIPIAIGLNEASKQRTAMGIAIIGGLISSTVLTLLIVPAAYGYVDRLRNWLGKKN